MIRKVLHIAFFSIAFLLIQAHTLMPHEHGEEMDSNEWVGFLAGLADLDLGGSHLEDFKPEETAIKINVEFNVEFVLSQEFFFTKDTPHSFPPPINSVFTKKHYTSDYSLRGPPAIV